MHSLKKLSLFFLTLLLVCSIGTSASAATKKVAPKPKPKPVTMEFTRIFYYQNGNAKGLASLKKNYKSIDVLAPQAYAIRGDGSLEGSVEPAALEVARAKKIKVMPLIVNKGFSSAVSAAFLGDTAKQEAAIAALVQEAVDQQYWGYQVDFEQADISYRDAFSTFVANLGAALHEKGMVVSVAVIPQISQNPDDYKSDYWNKFIGLFDYKALASSSDFISLMSYDDPGSKGPVTRYTWLTEVVNYALTMIPHSKLSIGVPLYYWRWNDTTGKRVATGTYTKLMEQAAQHRETWGYSTTEHTAYMRYYSRGSRYSIWYENSKSVQKKVTLIKDLRLHGFSAWALGQEAPSVHLALKTNKYTVAGELARK